MRPLVNFNELVAEYLRLFGEYARSNGDMDLRSIQSYLDNLASIVEQDDIKALQVELTDLKEAAAEFV